MFKAPGIKVLHPLLTATQEGQLQRHRGHLSRPAVQRHHSGAPNEPSG
ncbi:hypothetical protein M8494_08095 [Serratia ureilytica]